MSQRPRIGRENGSCAGLSKEMRNPHAKATAGDIHIAAKKPARPGRNICSASLDVRHSSSRLCVTSTRTSVLPIASVLTKAS